MPTYSDRVTINTEIGIIKATSSVTAADLSRDQISLKVIRYAPTLPPGMSVKKCKVLLLKVAGLVCLERVSLNLAFDTKAVGGPCTGQCLDAQEWSENGNLVVIGTEDGEALNYRFPGLGLEDRVVTELFARDMKLSLKQLGAHKSPSFHFLIAENDDPEPVEDSAWFAVGQNHDFLLGQLQL